MQVRDKEKKEVIVNDVFNWQHGWGKMRMGMDVDVDAAGTDDRCLYASNLEGREQRTPSLLCLSIARRMRAAMADRFFRLVSTVNIRNFAHNVVSITSRSGQGPSSTDRKVRDRDVQWLAWGFRM